MAEITGRMVERLDQYDKWLYDKTVPRLNEFRAFATRPLPEAFGVGMKGFGHVAKGIGESVGVGYMTGGIQHYAKAWRGGYGFQPKTGPMPAEWNKYFESIHPGLKPSPGRYPRLSAAGRRGVGAAGVLVRGLMPAFVLHGAVQDEMGFGVGLAKEIAGFAALGPGMSLGLQLGGWAGATAGSGALSVAGKVPGVKKLVGSKVAGRFAGALLGGPIGWLIGGMAAYETASWAVGMALHTLPAFAKQFKSDMARTGYGGDYTDSAGAITMRQRSLQVMGKSFVNARSALGQEGALLHV